MDDDRYERLCEDHYSDVVRVAFLITGDRQEALDIAQETFTRAFERWRQVAGMENQVGWLVRVASNQAISRQRRLTRRVRHEPSPGMETDGPDPALASALRRLTPSQRAVVVLRYYLDLSIETTAETLGKRPGTVRALSAQGVARLRDELGATWLEVRDD